MHRIKVAVLGLLLASGAQAQSDTSQKYRPAFKNLSGPEVVAVFISSTWCVGNRAPGLHEAIERAKLLLRERARGDSKGFRAVGVALDWHPDSGRAYLREFGEFDELALGSNWFGLAPETYIWADTAARAAIPQFVVYERTVQPAGRRIAFQPRRVRIRVYGGPEIVEWAQAGARIP